MSNGASESTIMISTSRGSLKNAAAGQEIRKNNSDSAVMSATLAQNALDQASVSLASTRTNERPKPASPIMVKNITIDSASAARPKSTGVSMRARKGMATKLDANWITRAAESVATPNAILFKATG